MNRGSTTTGSRSFDSDQESSEKLKAALVNEAVDILEHKGDLVAAREQLVELVAFQPEEADTRARLKFLAEETRAPEAYVRGLHAAAGATQDPTLQVVLWLEAAQIGYVV